MIFFFFLIEDKKLKMDETQLLTGNTNKYIVVKTGKVKNYREYLLGECLFAVEREEWFSFQKFLTEKTLVYTHEDDEIDVHELYYRAQTFEVDEKTAIFLLLNGTEKALKYIREGIVEPRN